MINNLSIVCRYFFFWVLFFFLERVVFLLWLVQKLDGASLIEISKSFIIGLWMDASMAGYITALPLLVTLIQWFIPAIKIRPAVLRVYTGLLIVLFSLICVLNYNIYREWGSKINFKVLDIAFHSPNEAIASAASSPVLSSIFTFILLIAASCWLSRKLILYKGLQKTNIFLKIFASILLLGINFLAIRGGWQLSPMNESMAYYSQHQLLNHSTINTEWALLRDILNNKSTSNPYNYYSSQQAEAIVKELYSAPQGNSTAVLTTQRPNIVLVIHESFTADLVKSLGGESGTAPQLEKLASEGILFTNIYASGDRTDKGVVAILNGFPSQATKSIMKENSKQQQLPSLSQSLLKKGYATSFFYGGESEFFNMKSYLLTHSYEKIIDKGSFEKKDMNSKWGAFDEVVYNKLIAETKNTDQPFFATLLTLTNHEPFELPGERRFKRNSNEDKFRSTAYYADSCLAAFVKNAQKQPWYKNTLFIVVADHGHRLPKNEHEIYHPNRFRIPLLFFGEVLKPEFRGTQISKIGSQTDIAATILTQLQVDQQAFRWSRDILNPAAKDFAFFNWDNGFGMVEPKQTITFDNVGKRVLFRKNENLPAEDERLLRNGKAYMQAIFQEFLSF